MNSISMVEYDGDGQLIYVLEDGSQFSVWIHPAMSVAIFRGLLMLQIRAPNVHIYDFDAYCAWTVKFPGDDRPGAAR